MNGLDLYRQQIAVALRELMRWAGQKREAEQQMSKLRNLIIANSNMLPDAEKAIFIRQANESFAGITDTIREMFRTHRKGLTPMMVRDKLVEAGFDLSSQTNPMASIHSVIRRLLDAGEIDRYGAADLGAYRWNLPVSDPEHEIHDPESFVKVNKTEGVKPKYGFPDPLNRRGKK